MPMKYDPLTFAGFRETNTRRNAEWNPNDALPLMFRALELGGEVGELLNLVKKLERDRLGLKGSRANMDDVADELADVFICLDLVAMHLNIDLAAAVRRKFNATSDKVGLSVKLPRWCFNCDGLGHFNLNNGCHIDCSYCAPH